MPTFSLAVGALLGVLWILSLFFLGVWVWQVRETRGRSERPTFRLALVGFWCSFLDTLGIGNFAPTTAMFRLWRLVPDELIPGTLNVGYSIPVALEASIFVTAITVDTGTLVSMIGMGALGGWFGARVVSRLPRRPIQIGLGTALFIAAVIFLMTNLGLLPAGGEATSLSGGRLAFAVAVNFLLGAFSALGIGNYAPCLILVGLLGMNLRAAFPIMMGSAAFMLPMAGIRFARTGRHHAPSSLGLTLAGLPAVFVAAFIVKSLPLEALRWLVVVVVLFAAISLLNAARREAVSAGEVEE